MRVLAIGAHADDVELLCAGTLAHYSSQGAAVAIAVLTNGELGSPHLSRAETSQVRRAEAERASRMLDAELIWVGEPDGFLFDNVDTRLLVIDVLRRVRPDVVFSHHPDDYHPDHRAAGRLTLAARLLARERSLATPHDPIARVPPLFFMDNFMAAGASAPDVWVDITATMSRKSAMLAEHTSQNAGRQQRTGTDFVSLMHVHAERRGRDVGVRYAEAFRIATTYPASSAEVLAPADSDVVLPVVTNQAVGHTGDGSAPT
jgi:LmbE family N-acetylglucosaminyl deacetylase